MATKLFNFLMYIALCVSLKENLVKYTEGGLEKVMLALKLQSRKLKVCLIGYVIIFAYANQF